MAYDDMTNGFGSFLGVFLLGAATGAAIALLTAPRSGREIRAQLKDTARDLMERAPDTIRNAGARAMKAGQAAYDSVRGKIDRNPGLS
jgi:gas vesicle protein